MAARPRTFLSRHAASTVAAICIISAMEIWVSYIVIAASGMMSSSRPLSCKASQVSPKKLRQKWRRSRRNAKPVSRATGRADRLSRILRARARGSLSTMPARGLTIGGAQVSELHSNFLINLGGASANDLETLGESVRERVKTHSGVDLEWEIKRVGVKS